MRSTVAEERVDAAYWAYRLSLESGAPESELTAKWAAYQAAGRAMAIALNTRWERHHVISGEVATP